MSLTVVSQLMRLEDQCLLHLICHLEDYLPEMLALLPRHLRHRLLLNLPAADVCRLENTMTAVSAGIDMDGAVWPELARSFSYEFEKGHGHRRGFANGRPELHGSRVATAYQWG